MREFVAVNDLETILDVQALKREALMFDRIAIKSITSFLKDAFAHKDVFNDISEALANTEWLLERGIIFEPPHFPRTSIQTDEFERYSTASLQQAIQIASLVSGKSVEALLLTNEGEEKESLSEVSDEELAKIVRSDAFREHTARLSEYHLRMLSIQLRDLNYMDAFPILQSDIPFVKELNPRKDEIVKVVLNSLPIPDSTTSWEQILEYRSDPDSQSRFLDLRHWISEVARGELTPSEVEEKLAYLLSQYRRRMEIHRMKTNMGTLETFITAGAEFLGDLLTLKWGKAAQALFSVRRRQVTLLEGELSLPGSEVAYIFKTRDTFS